jgi:hypothetical protein
MITTQDIATLENSGSLGITTSLPTRLRILDGSYEDARKEFYANLDNVPIWTYRFNDELLADDGTIAISDTERIMDAMFVLPHVAEVK